jgi:hypothetical protein
VRGVSYWVDLEEALPEQMSWAWSQKIRPFIRNVPYDDRSRRPNNHRLQSANLPILARSKADFYLNNDILRSWQDRKNSIYIH